MDGRQLLLITFMSLFVSSVVSKLGATRLDVFLFMAISYSVGSCVAYLSHLSDRTPPSSSTRAISIRYGVIGGVVNFVAYSMLLLALQSGPGALVFSALGLDLVFIVFLSQLLFRERLNWKGWSGVALAAVSLWLLR